MDNWLASHLFFLEWAGASLWDTRIVIADPTARASRANIPRPPLVTRPLRRLLLGEEIIYLSGIELTPAQLKAVTAGLSPRQSYFIKTYPSYGTRLAADLLRERIELEVHPKVVVSGAETLTAANAATLRAAFRCPVVNQYSSWEVPHMAQTCPDNPGLLHVNSERVILRVVREDGSPAARRERGRVVLTSLSNYVMPLINYELGDWAVAGDSCGCGRGFPTLVGIDGRTGELIRTPAGKTIAPGTLEDFLTFTCDALPYIWEYQAVQTSPDAVVLRVAPTAQFTPEFAEKLRGALENFLGPDVAVQVQTLDRISSEPSGKRPIIKSDLPLA